MCALFPPDEPIGGAEVDAGASQALAVFDAETARELALARSAAYSRAFKAELPGYE